MARKKGPPAQAVKQAKANVLQDSAGTAQPNATAAKPVNLTDGQAIKRALDEHVSKTLTSAGLEEVFFVSNVKIGLGLLTCLVALLAQFYPGKLPDTWWMLAACVSLYGLLTLALNVFTARWEASAFLFLRTSEAVAGCHDIRVSSSMPRFSYTYTLTLETAAPRKHRVKVSSAFQVTSFFTQDGFLEEQLWAPEVQSLWRRLCQGSSKAS